MFSLAQSNPDNTALVLLIVLLGGTVVGVCVRKFQLARKGYEQQIAQLRAERDRQSAQAAQLNNPFQEQHKRLNDLQITKLTTEISLLQRQLGQLDTHSPDENRMAAREYHELMVEKTKLEIDSLRLHIAEVRQRLDDWRFDKD